MDNKKTNDELIKFWNNAIKLPDEYKKEEVKKEAIDLVELAPSKKLYDEVIKLSNLNNVLDYGCGNAWASIIAGSNNAKVLAVDMGNNIIETANYYIKAYGNENNIETKVIDENWLSNREPSFFDGIICSNVLDVLPFETSKNIIKELARIAKKDALIVVGLNYYVSDTSNLVDNKYIIINGILRLLSLSDDEWKELFDPYFEVLDLKYFSWPQEKEEKRRLFTLKKRY